MNDITNITGGPGLTMSSLEIAGLTGKAHRNVTRDIKKMLDALKVEHVAFRTTYVDGKGEVRESFNLPRHETLLLVTGYSIPLRDRVLRRVEELEAMIAHATPAPTTMVSDLTAEVRQVVGGIVKSVVHAQLTEVMPQMVAGYVAEHNLSIADGVTAGEVCDLSRVTAKYPRGISARVSTQMSRFCRVRNIDIPVTRLGRVRAQVFPTHVAREWLDLEGRALIKRWLAEKANQTELRLVGGRAA